MKKLSHRLKHLLTKLAEYHMNDLIQNLLITLITLVVKVNLRYLASVFTKCYYTVYCCSNLHPRWPYSEDSEEDDAEEKSREH